MGLTSSLQADLLILAIIACIGIHIAWLWQHSRLFYIDPLFAFWGGIFVVYVFQPLAFGSALADWHGAALLEKTLGWSVFGILCVIIGYELRAGRKLAFVTPRLPSTLNPERLQIGAWVLIGLGIIGYLHFFDSAGGIWQWLSVGRGATDYSKVITLVAQLSHFLPLGVVLLLFHANLYSPSFLTKSVAWTLNVLMWLWFVYLGSRSKTIGFAMLVLAAAFLPKRRNPPLLVLGLLFLTVFVIVRFQAEYRSYFVNLSFNLEEIDLDEARGVVLPSFLGGDSDTQKADITAGLEFNCVMSVVQLVPHLVDYNYGYGHVEVLTRFVPRSLWPDKPYPMHEAIQGVMQLAGLSGSYIEGTDLLTGPALTFVGHWYYVGGAVGLLLGGLLTGILLRFVRELYDRNPGNAADTILYSFLFGIGFIEAAATPWFWMWTLPFVVLPVLGVIFISGQGAGKGTARNLAARRNNLPREGEHRLSRDSR